MKIGFYLLRHTLCQPHRRLTYSQYYPLEITAWLLEIIFYTLIVHPLIGTALMLFRVTIFPASALNFMTHFASFFIIQRYYHLPYESYVKVISSLGRELTAEDLDIKNAAALNKKIQVSIYKEVLNSDTSSDELIKCFYQGKFKEEFRKGLFLFLASRPSLNPLSSSFYNIVSLMRTWVRNGVVLSKEETEILSTLATGTFILENNERLSIFFKECKNLNIPYLDFSHLGINIFKLKEQTLTFNSSSYSLARQIPWLDRSLFRQDHTFNTFTFIKNFLRECSSLEESYHYLFGKKPKLKELWLNRIQSSRFEAQKLYLLSYSIIAHLWNLNYDRVLKEISNPNWEAPILIDSSVSELELLIFGQFLKRNYTDERILHLLSSAPRGIFLDTLRMSLAFSGQNIQVKLPKKLKNFHDLHEFLTLHVKYSPKFKEKLEQEEVKKIDGLPFEDYQIFVPKNRKDLFFLGQSLRICVGASDTYAKDVQQGLCYIIALKERGEYKYCVQVERSNLKIMQASTFSNQKMDYSLKFSLEKFLAEKLE